MAACTKDEYVTLDAHNLSMPRAKALIKHFKCLYLRERRKKQILEEILSKKCPESFQQILQDCRDEMEKIYYDIGFENVMSEEYDRCKTAIQTTFK